MSLYTALGIYLAVPLGMTVAQHCGLVAPDKYYISGDVLHGRNVRTYATHSLLLEFSRSLFVTMIGTSLLHLSLLAVSTVRALTLPAPNGQYGTASSQMLLTDASRQDPYATALGGSHSTLR